MVKKKIGDKGILDFSCGVNVLELLRLKGAVFTSVDITDDHWTITGVLGTGDFSLPVKSSEGHAFLGKLVDHSKEVAKEKTKRAKNDERVGASIKENSKKADVKVSSRKETDAIAIPIRTGKNLEKGSPNSPKKTILRKAAVFAPPKSVVGSPTRKRLSNEGRALLTKFKNSQPLEKKRRTTEELACVDVAYSYLLDEQYSVVLDWISSWK